MTAKTTSAKKAASPKVDKGEAARAEKNGKPRLIDYRGIQIELPEQLKASVLFRVGRLRDGDIQGATRLIEAILGPVQLDRVLDKLDADGVTLDDVDGLTSIGDLLNSALEEYGLGGGESPASTTS